MVKITRRRLEYLFEGDYDEVKIIKNALSFKDPKAVNRSRYGAGASAWASKVCLCRKSSFDQGFIYNVIEALDKKGVEYEVLGENNFPTDGITAPKAFDRQERAYQLESMKAWMNKRYGIIRASVRSGKTMIFGQIAKALVQEQPNIKIAFVTESKSIFNQNKGEIAKFVGTSVGEIAGDKRDLGENVTCIMAQTIDAAFRRHKKVSGQRTTPPLKYPEKAAEMLKLLKQFDMVCVDECHLFISPKRRDVIKYFTSARYTLGLSATPFKSSDPINSWRMYGLLGGEVYKIEEEKLRNNKILTTDKIIFLKVNSFQRTNNYVDCYQKNIVESKERMSHTLDVVQICNELKLKLLIFVDRIDHGNLYANTIGCDFVHGGHSDEERESMKSKFLEMTGGVMVASSIFVAGVSFTEVDCTIALAGGLEETRQQQRRGRALGVGSRDRSITFDFWDAETKYLKKHSASRASAYFKQSQGLKINKLDLNKEGKAIELKEFMSKWFKINE